MRSLMFVAVVTVAWLLAMIAVAPVRADTTYYGYRTTTTAGSYGNEGGPITICSAQFSVTTAQQLTSLGLSYNPLASTYPTVSVYLALTTVQGGDLSPHTAVAISNNGHALSVGPDSTLPNPSQVTDSNFAFSHGFDGTLQPDGTNYALCISFSNQIAIYYTTAPAMVEFDYSTNDFSGTTTPTFNSNELVAVWASTITPSAASTYGDPFFHGFWDQEFYVHGRAGAVYNLLSDRHVQLNSRFVFLSNVTCPTLPAEELSKPPKVHCSSHPGTYFGEMGLKTISGDSLYIRADAVSVGFDQVSVSGQAIEVGDLYGMPPLASVQHELHTSSAVDGIAASEQSSHSHPARSTLYVPRTSARSLIVHAGLYELLIENSDNYVDLVTVHVTSWPELLDVVQPSGLMGVTWNSTAAMPPVEDAHRERDDELMGCNLENDKFCAARLTVQQ